MSNTQPQMISGSEVDGRVMIMDEKKRKRMLSNRESARRSRMKKQKLLEDLVSEVASLKVEIRNNTNEYEVLMQKTLILESDNSLLKAEQMELAQYLRNLELMQNQMELLQMNLMQPGGFADQILDIKEPHVGSWQCHGSTQPAIMASAGMFNY
ncbi:bZIP transcription factor 53-like [Durio zibethinus]|uniref:BZIP transcription factor 53-like n=1 Tax=Durio zibethinus TaxID=66656 RepID=A0A6P6A7G1_DURZI|nr:bZIP transcription factor 53-like [Durio zibethinus]